MDTADIATLNDALGSAGVDLRVCDTYSLELLSFSLGFQRQKKNLYSGRTSNISPTAHTKTGHANNLSSLHSTLDISAPPCAPSAPNTKSHEYLTTQSTTLPSLCVRDSKPRRANGRSCQPPHGHPIRSTRVIIRGMGHPCGASSSEPTSRSNWPRLEKVEREEEMKVRRERKERADMAAAHAAALAAQAAGGPSAVAEVYDDADGGAKKKRKKEGPGVTARNMSEDVRKKMSNAVASQAAGIGGKYSWMTAANASAPAPRPKAATAASPNPRWGEHSGGHCCS